ncbi:hypothetical protein [Kibdelosporangium aridum]|uniref:hypothetical protein n=1 Tax=Kibdelosporangium aridum TaxID=2030 RepID=UPI0035E6EAA3
MIGLRPRGWPLWLFRVMVTFAALSMFAQAALAGGLLAGHFDMLALHRDNSTVSVLIVTAMTVAGVLLHRPGRGPSWPMWVSLVCLVVSVGQALLGYTRMLSLHVPFGVLITAALLLLLVWAWRPMTQESQ